MVFDAPQADGFFEYTISGFADSSITAFEISQFSEAARIIHGEIAGPAPFRFTFQDSSRNNLPKKYLVAAPPAWLQPDSIFIASPSNLRRTSLNADFIIITHEDFHSEAMRLANYRQARDGLTATVVLISDIFNDFSGGVYDPVAIRDFLKFALEHWPLPPAYVLLFGDGDYDYKNIFQNIDKNWIPPFEIDGADFEVRATDDWYTYLTGKDLRMDLSIGRLPVRTMDEARIVVNKIIRYETAGDFGAWRNRAVVVADDILTHRQPMPFESVHTEEAEKLAETHLSPRCDLEKIYLIEHSLQADSTGRLSKPTARTELIRQINRGALIVNYTGHSSMFLMAEENVFDLDAVDALTNVDKLPFIFSASSQFPKFDDPLYVSIPEKMITKPDGGAIAIIGSIGLVNFSFPGNMLNQAFYAALFANKAVRLSDALRSAKNSLSPNSQIQKHHLIGDPTMRLVYPTQQVELTFRQPDTLKGQSLLRLAGTLSQNGQIQNNFNGEIEIQAYGSKKAASYPIEGTGQTIQYLRPGVLLFRARQFVNEGRFQSSFFIPADVVNEAGPTGKISLYSWNAQIDGAGFAYPIYAGGLDSTRTDTTAPAVTMAIIEGHAGADTVLPNFVLQITLADSSGINLFAANEKGIFLALDGRDEIEVSEFFVYDPGSFTRGNVRYHVTGLAAGSRTIAVRAWDNFNNAAEERITVVVTTIGEGAPAPVPQNFALHQNFPNPFNPSTNVRIDLPRKTYVRVQIYNMLGQKVRTLMDEDKLAGFYTLRWDGQNGDGHEMPSGIYFVRMTAENFARTIKILKIK